MIKYLSKTVYSFQYVRIKHVWLHAHLIVQLSHILWTHLVMWHLINLSSQVTHNNVLHNVQITYQLIIIHVQISASITYSSKVVYLFLYAKISAYHRVPIVILISILRVWTTSQPLINQSFSHTNSNAF
jgi:hypothetical protein